MLAADGQRPSDRGGPGRVHARGAACRPSAARPLPRRPAPAAGRRGVGGGDGLRRAPPGSSSPPTTASGPCPSRCAAGRRHTALRAGACRARAAGRRGRSARPGRARRPPAGTTQATMRSPRSSSGSPRTAAWSTAGCSSSAPSISPAPMRKPPLLMRSVERRPTRRSEPRGVEGPEVAGLEPAVAQRGGAGLGQVEVLASAATGRGPRPRRPSRRRPGPARRRRRAARSRRPGPRSRRAPAAARPAGWRRSSASRSSRSARRRPGR